jgi:hypothetical protein
MFCRATIDRPGIMRRAEISITLLRDNIYRHSRQHVIRSALVDVLT